MASTSHTKKWAKRWIASISFLSLMALFGEMPAHGSQLERDALLRDVDALRVAGDREGSLQAAHRLVLSSDAPDTQQAFRALALVKLSIAYKDLLRFDEAENATRLALAMLERGNNTPDKVMAVIWGGLADLSYRQGSFSEAVDQYLRAIALAKNPNSRGEQMQLARLELELAQVYQKRGQHKLAEPLLRTTLASHEALYQSEPLRIAVATRALGNTLRGNGQLDDARALLEKAISMTESLPETELFRAEVNSDKGLVELDSRDFPKAIAAFEQSLRMLETLPRNPPHTHAGVLFNLSWALVENNNYAAAIAPARQALALRESITSINDSDLPLYIDQVAKIERKLGHVELAKSLESRSAQLRQRSELARSDPMETPAAVVEQVPPVYPAIAKRMGKEGRVLMRVLIDEDGKVRKIQIKESSGDRLLDEAAMQSVQGARYSPARSKSGQAVASSSLIPIMFRLEPHALPLDTTHGSYASRVARAVRSNIVLSAPVNISTATEITLKVATDGKILEQRLTRSSGEPLWDAAAMAGVAKTNNLPLDVNGLAPTVLILSMKPNE